MNLLIFLLVYYVIYVFIYKLMNVAKEFNFRYSKCLLYYIVLFCVHVFILFIYVTLLMSTLSTIPFVLYRSSAFFSSGSHLIYFSY